MRAQLIVSEKFVYDDGAIRQVVIWRVPVPVPPCQHFLKYRLAYVVDRVRVVGFDNERGKGDHAHAGGLEVEYKFSTVAALLVDFRRLVEQARQVSEPGRTAKDGE